MKKLKSITVVGAAVLFVAIVGFFITLDVAPHVAYARLFIDIGLIIGLVAILMAFDKDLLLEISNITNALIDLKLGKYDIKIEAKRSGKLTELADNLNALAKALKENHTKQAEIKKSLREELLPNLKKTEVIPSAPAVLPQQSAPAIQSTQHSHHPEIGPVEPIKFEFKKEEAFFEKNLQEQSSELFSSFNESKITNPLTDSIPPSIADKTEKNSVVQEQDLGELYQNLIDAQRDLFLEPTEYQSFIMAIDEARTKLKTSHSCKNIYFDVIRSSNNVALQPKIVK